MRTYNLSLGLENLESPPRHSSDKNEAPHNTPPDTESDVDLYQR